MNPSNTKLGKRKREEHEDEKTIKRKKHMKEEKSSSFDTRKNEEMDESGDGKGLDDSNFKDECIVVQPVTVQQPPNWAVVQQVSQPVQPVIVQQPTVQPVVVQQPMVQQPMVQQVSQPMVAPANTVDQVKMKTGKKRDDMDKRDPDSVEDCCRELDRQTRAKTRKYLRNRKDTFKNFPRFSNIVLAIFLIILVFISRKWISSIVGKVCFFCSDLVIREPNGRKYCNKQGKNTPINPNKLVKEKDCQKCPKFGECANGKLKKCNDGYIIRKAICIEPSKYSDFAFNFYEIMIEDNIKDTNEKKLKELIITTLNASDLLNKDKDKYVDETIKMLKDNSENLRIKLEYDQKDTSNPKYSIKSKYTYWYWWMKTNYFFCRLIIFVIIVVIIFVWKHEKIFQIYIETSEQLDLSMIKKTYYKFKNKSVNKK